MTYIIIVIALSALVVGLVAAVIIFRAGAVDNTKAQAALTDAEQSAAGGVSRLWARLRHKQ